MSMRDANLTFAFKSTGIQKAAGTAILGDVIYIDGNNYGNGEPTMFLDLSINTVVTSGGAATVNFHLVSDSTAALATDGSATYHWSSGVIALATLAAGYRRVLALPMLPEYENYLGLLQTTATATITGGTVSAFLTRDPLNWRALPEGVS